MFQNMIKYLLVMSFVIICNNNLNEAFATTHQPTQPEHDLSLFSTNFLLPDEWYTETITYSGDPLHLTQLANVKVKVDGEGCSIQSSTSANKKVLANCNTLSIDSMGSGCWHITGTIKQLNVGVHGSGMIYVDAPGCTVLVTRTTQAARTTQAISVKGSAGTQIVYRSTNEVD